jgi:hypothetical protein
MGDVANSELFCHVNTTKYLICVFHTCKEYKRIGNNVMLKIMIIITLTKFGILREISRVLMKVASINLNCSLHN